MVASKILYALAITLAVFSTASAKPVPKGNAAKVAKAGTALKVAVAADTPVCNSANNGAWQCIPDRAQCYLNTWYNYPCSGGTVCDPSNGQCAWPSTTATTATPSSATTTTHSSTTTTTHSSTTTTTTKPTTTTSATTTSTTTTKVTTTSKTTTSSVPVSTGKAKFVTYIDNTSGSTSAAVFDVPGSVPKNAYNIVNIGFWQSYGPWDTGYTWTTLDAATRQSYISSMHAAGVKVLITAFGAAEAPTSAGVNPTTAANNLAAFVKANGFDGADIDWEDSNAMQAGTGEAWLVTFMQALRAQLPSPTYIITHAPQAPYFIDDKTLYPNGAYIAVDAKVGSLIDWYNVQWYNQGTSSYDTCESLLFTANGWSTGTSLFELIDRGFAQEKLVIGKPVTAAGAANTGYMDVNTLAGCLTQAQAKGWNAGVMGWQFTLDASGSWINTLAATF